MHVGMSLGCQAYDIHFTFYSLHFTFYKGKVVELLLRGLGRGLDGWRMGVMVFYRSF